MFVMKCFFPNVFVNHFPKIHILFPEDMWNYTSMRRHTPKYIYVCNLLHIQNHRFSLGRNFSLSIIYMHEIKNNYKILQKKSIALITFMYTLSRTMYLFEANLKFLANTSTPDIAQYHLE